MRPVSMLRAAWSLGLAAPWFRHALARLVGRLALAWRVSRERRALMQLSDEQLKDIGLSRSQAFREASRHFLDIPDPQSRTPRRRWP